MLWIHPSAARLAYLKDVTLGEMEGAGRDVDPLACLHLDAVDALVIGVVIHGVVGREQNAGVVDDGGAAVGCDKRNKGKVGLYEKHE